MYVGIGVSHIDDCAVPCDGDIVADSQSRVANKVDILLDIDVMSNAKFGDAFLVGNDRLHPNARTDVDVPPNMHKPWVAEQERLEHNGVAAEASEYVTIVNYAF